MVERTSSYALSAFSLAKFTRDANAAALKRAVTASAAAHECDNLKPIARLQSGVCMLLTGNDFQVPLDRQEPRGELQLDQQLGDGALVRDLMRRPIHDDLHAETRWAKV